MGIPLNSIKTDSAIIYDNELYIVIESEHARLGRGSAFCRVKMRNPKTNQIITATLRDSDNILDADLDRRKLQFSYKDGHFFHFMDRDTYEDITVDEAAVGDSAVWLTDDLKLVGVFHQDRFVNLEIPQTLTVKIAQTEPGVKGDSARSSIKPP